jgi:hypothetical protein
LGIHNRLRPEGARQRATFPYFECLSLVLSLCLYPYLHGDVITCDCRKKLEIRDSSVNKTQLFKKKMNLTGLTLIVLLTISAAQSNPQDDKLESLATRVDTEQLNPCKPLHIFQCLKLFAKHLKL